VFAPLAAELAAGRCDPADLGDEVASLNMSGWPPTRPRADGGVEGVIVAIDRFGNLISNIESASVMALDHPTIYVAGLSLPLKRTYGEAEAGEYLGLINSFDVLEVARARGSAAQGLSLAIGTPISAVPGGSAAQFRRS
jgi:S-adenosylmethionine hydrolase